MNIAFVNLLENSGIILLIILGIAAVIALVTFIIYRLTHPKLKDEDKISEEQALKEELDRVLEPVDDEKVAKDISSYKSPDDEE